ncbi:hypothetical protein [Flavobacterium sp.]|jgi:hypothetical protein|uniref:hypothetical protein n=1 Tax=Flavobacterium sp. TaxID=239 RepID=UPI00286F35E3|nr:hypothetical protein [Flavobacterium sp.]
MTIYQKQENEKYLNNVLEMGKFWIWPGANASYTIENGLFIANTEREFFRLKEITTKEYHNKIQLRNNTNN